MIGVSTALPLTDFDFPFPEDLIAVSPAEPRDSSRLMVVDRRSGAWEHRIFSDLPKYLKPGDCVVLNRTKVFSSRLLGTKTTGGKVDLLLVRELEPGFWAVLSSGLKRGMSLRFPGSLEARIEGLNEDGEYLCRFSHAEIMPYLEKYGLPPLPPYILKKRKERPASPDDVKRYQTVYACDAGSIAAPTAGLHFTEGLITGLKSKGVRIAYVVLHVGRGTFRPITTQDAKDHTMLPEWYSMNADQAALVSQTRSAGGRVVSVGTTSTRTLETLARQPQGFASGEGWSDLFIFPGFEFKAAGGLVTNFHLPKSTPLILASAFLGREKLLAAYQEAFREKYRLYSYGDAMLIL